MAVEAPATDMMSLAVLHAMNTGALWEGVHIPSQEKLQIKNTPSNRSSSPFFPLSLSLCLSLPPYTQSPPHMVSLCQCAHSRTNKVAFSSFIWNRFEMFAFHVTVPSLKLSLSLAQASPSSLYVGQPHWMLYAVTLSIRAYRASWRQAVWGNNAFAL